MSSEVSRRERRYLLDVRDNARLAIDFLGSLDPVALEAETKTLYAVVRCLEIVSEAVRNPSPNVAIRHPHLPWADIRAAGNVYRHEYGRVSARLVHHTVRVSLPELLVAVDVEIERDP